MADADHPTSVTAFTIAQTISDAEHFSSDDRSRTYVLPAIFMQIVMNLSILTACIPSLKGVIDIFLSGTSLIAVPEQYRTTLSNSTSHGIKSRVRTALGLSVNKSTVGTQIDTSQNRSQWPTEQMKSVSGQHSSHVSTNGKKQGPTHIPGKSESQKSLTEDAILRTIDYEIEYEDGHTKGTPSSNEDEISVHGARR
jgi:hypothetical protein